MYWFTWCISTWQKSNDESAFLLRSHHSIFSSEHESINIKLIMAPRVNPDESLSCRAGFHQFWFHRGLGSTSYFTAATPNRTARCLWVRLSPLFLSSDLFVQALGSYWPTIWLPFSVRGLPGCFYSSWKPSGHRHTLLFWTRRTLLNAQAWESDSHKRRLWFEGGGCGGGRGVD